MNGYLVFALLTTLQLVPTGVAHYSVDYIHNDVLASQFDVTIDGSLSRYVLMGQAKSDFMQVERAAAFGQVYTAFPGPAMNAEAAARQLPSTPAPSAGQTAANPGAKQQSGAAGGTASAKSSALSAASSIVATASAPKPLPPVAFSLGDVMRALAGRPDSGNFTFTIPDPVQSILEAVTPAQVSVASDKMKSAPTGAPQTARQLSMRIVRRGNTSYVEIPAEQMILAVHPSAQTE